LPTTAFSSVSRMSASAPHLGTTYIPSTAVTAFSLVSMLDFTILIPRIRLLHTYHLLDVYYLLGTSFLVRGIIY